MICRYDMTAETRQKELAIESKNLKNVININRT
jgi:hypothetical protein